MLFICVFSPVFSLFLQKEASHNQPISFDRFHSYFVSRPSAVQYEWHAASLLGKGIAFQVNDPAQTHMHAPFSTSEFVVQLLDHCSI